MGFIGVNAAIGAFNKAINDLAALDDLSQKVGASVTKLSQLQKVAKQFDADFGGVEAGLIKLSRGMASIDDASSKANAALSKLGISARDSSGNLRDPAAVLIDISKSLQTFSDGAKKAEIATDLFGKSGANLLPYLNDVAGNVDRFNGVSKEAAERASKFQDSLGGLKVQSDQLVQSVSITLLPAFTSLITAINEAAESGSRLDKILGGLQNHKGFNFNPASSVYSPGVSAKGLIPNYEDRPTVAYGTLLSRDAANMKVLPRVQIGGSLEDAKKQISGFNEQLEAFRDSNPFKDKTSALDQYNEKMAKLAELQKSVVIPLSEVTRWQVQFKEELNKSLGVKEKDNKLTADQSQLLRELQNEINLEGESVVRVNLEKIDAQEKYLSGLKSAQKATDDIVQSSYDEIAKTQKQIDLLVLGEDAIRAKEIATLDETIANTELAKSLVPVNENYELQIQYIDSQIASYKELKDARLKTFKNQDELEGLEKVKKASEDMFSAATRASDNLSRSLTDALMRGFEGGKSFAENFKETLINMFKTMVLQPVVKLLIDSSGLSKAVNTVTTSISGGGASSGGGFDSLKSLFSGGNSTGNGFFDKAASKVASLFSGSAAGVSAGSSVVASGTAASFATNSAASLGSSSLPNATSAYLGSQSASAGTGLTAATNFSSYLPWAGAAIQALTGDVKGAAFTAAGAAIGTIFPVVGTAIGAVVGSLVGSFFGGSKPKRESTAVRQTFDGSGNQLTSRVVDGPGKNTTAYLAGLTGTNQNFAKALTGYLSAMDADVTKLNLSSVYGERGGKKGKGRFSGSIDGKGFDLGYNKYESYSAYLAAVMGVGLKRAIQKSSLSDGLKSLFDGYSKSAHIKSLMEATIKLNAASEELNDTWGLSVDEAAKVARSMGKTTLAFTQNMAEVAFGLKTAGEQIIFSRDMLFDSYTSITGSSAAPDSLRAFDTALSRIDVTTKAGLQTFYKLFELRSQFASLDSTMSSLKTSVGSAIYSIMTPSQQLASSQAALQVAFGSLNLTVPGSVQELVALGQSIDYTTESGLNLAAAFPSLVDAFNDAQDATDALVGSMQELDINRFKTLVDYRRATSYVTNGISLNQLPSYDVGTPFVNGDQIAQIHHGERILTAADNASLMERLANPSENQQALISELRALRQELLNQRSNQQSENIAMLTKTERISKAVEQLNNEGVILRNTDNSNEPVVLDVRVLA
ncbi:MAG: hypothetical protein ACAH12_03605 [Methylophilaceae bacterium]